MLKFLSCGLIVLTLGLFTLVINTFLFWLTSVISQSFGLGLVISDPVWWNAFLGALVVSIVSFILSMLLKDELKGSNQPVNPVASAPGDHLQIGPSKRL